MRLAEWEIETGDKRARFLVRSRRGAYDDVHAPYPVDFVVIDLRKNDVLLDADGVIAAAVETPVGHSAEVAHARQCDIDQPVEELVHSCLPKRHLHAYGLILADLEGGDRFARLGDHRLLPSDPRQLFGRHIDDLAIAHGLAHAHVQNDLGELRHLHGILVAKLLDERLAYDVLIVFFQARHVVLRYLLHNRSGLRGLLAVSLALRLRFRFGLRLFRLSRLLL